MALIRSIATVGGYTLASRILGFVRDVLVAAFLGAGPLADAFVVALRLPNLFRAFSAEGAFSAAFVPMLSRLVATEGRLAALRFAEETLAVLILPLGSILNSLGRFAAMASAPNLFNLSQIAALFLITPFVPTVAHALAYGVALAGILQFLHLVHAGHREGVRLRLVRPRLTPQVRRMLTLMAPPTIGAAVTPARLV